MQSTFHPPPSFFPGAVSAADAKKFVAEQRRIRLEWILRCSEFNRCRRMIVGQQTVCYRELRWHRKFPV